jgi:hypothetical protein
MIKSKKSAKELTDEEVLKEFVRRFQCDGAVLIYLDSNTEFGFGRWCNSKGQHWVNDLFNRFKKPVFLPTTSFENEGGVSVPLS